MKTAKRLCAALLALALIFTLAGCNAQTTEPTPTPTPAQSETPRARCGAGCARHVRSL